MDKIVAKQNAKKGWIIQHLNEMNQKIINQINEMGNKVFSTSMFQLNAAAAELTMELDIFKEIMITKMGITPEQIIEAEKIIMDRMEKDNEIIKKYKNDTTKTVDQRLEAMKTDGISEKAYIKIAALLKEKSESENSSESSSSK
jgi:heterodisulfide reductase subunit C